MSAYRAEHPASRPGVSRRAFLHMATVLAASVPLASAACAPVRPPAASQTGAPTAPPASAARANLPAYVAFRGARADLAPTDDGVQAGYLSYPRELVKAVQRAPGSGGDVTVFTQTARPLPPAVDANLAWQEVNKQLNANLKM